MQYVRSFLWLLTGLALSAGMISCVNPPDYPEEPVIVYEGVNKRQIYQFTNGPVDSITIQFSFTDGDGDLSFPDQDSTDIIYFDSRLPNNEQRISLPVISSEGTGNGISGDIFFTVINSGQGICCIFNGRGCAEDPSFPVDTFSYSFQLQDRAGNRSNVIRTETLEILCLGQ